MFGEVDDELYEGDLLYTPVVKKWYYEVVITDIAVGGESLNLDCKKVMKLTCMVFKKLKLQIALITKVYNSTCTCTCYGLNLPLLPWETIYLLTEWEGRTGKYLA